MVWDESQFVVERLNQNLVSIGVIIQAATATTGMAAGQKASSHFKKLIESLSGES